MTTFSYTPITNGATSDVAQINTPFTNLANIINGSVDAGNLAANAVGNSELAPNAVTDTEVAAGADLDVAKLDAGTVGSVLRTASGPTPTWLALGSTGALLYAGASDVAYTNAPTDGQVLRAVGTTPTWKTGERVRARMSGAQTISNDSAAAVAFAGTDDEDTDAMHDPASNNTRITFTTAGFYVVLGGGFFAANATGRRRLFIRRNGTTTVGDCQIPTTPAGTPLLQVMAARTFAAADYVELVAFQDSGGNLAFGGTGEEVFFAAWRQG